MPLQTWTEPRNRPLQIPRARVAVPANGLPVSLIEAKQQLSIAVDDDSHDPRLQRLIAAAVEQVEQDTNLSLLDKTYVQTQPWILETNILFRPIIDVTSVRALTQTGGVTTIDPSDYFVDFAAGTLRLFKTNIQADPVEDRLEITYRAGHAASVPSLLDGFEIAWNLDPVFWGPQPVVWGSPTILATVPELAKHAILLLVSFWFENPDMIMPDNQTSMRAYYSITGRLKRSRYP
jgi:uncharacterized phiE125 gp8 family phage protein